MKKLLLGTIVAALLSVCPVMAMAGVAVSIGLPPLIVFAAPPELIVIPGTYAYVVPDVAEDIFFYDGYWWRPWQGHWYRSRSYSEGWAYYAQPPSVLVRIPSDWRDDYRQHRWGGHEWNYSHLRYEEVQSNWSRWKKEKHWEKPENWPVRTPETPAQEQHKVQKRDQAVEPQTHKKQQTQPQAERQVKKPQEQKQQQTQPQAERQVKKPQEQKQQQTQPQAERQVKKPREQKQQQSQGQKPSKDATEKQE